MSRNIVMKSIAKNKKMGVTKIDTEAADTVRFDITFEASLMCRLKSQKKQMVKNIAKHVSSLESNRV